MLIDIGVAGFGGEHLLLKQCISYAGKTFTVFIDPGVKDRLGELVKGGLYENRVWNALIKTALNAATQPPGIILSVPESRKIYITNELFSEFFLSLNVLLSQGRHSNENAAVDFIADSLDSHMQKKRAAS